MNDEARGVSRDHLIDAGFSFFLTVVALSAFQQSYGGIEYLVLGAVGALLGVAVALAATRFRLSALIAVGVMLVVYVVIGGTIALRRDATAGVLPSLATISGASRAAISGWKQLLTTVPPVGHIGTLLSLPMFCGIFSAGGATLLATRVKAILPAVVLPSGVLVLGLLCGLDAPVSVLLHGSVFAGLAIVWMAIRNRRVRLVASHSSDLRRRAVGAVLLVGVAGFVGLLAGPHVPFTNADERVILRDKVEPPFDPAQYPSPLAEYRAFVKDQFDDTVLFTISGLPKDVPVRMATMDDYDGVVWRVTGGESARAGASGFFERVGSDVAPDFAGTRATISVEIKQWTDVWLPTVGEVIAVHFGGPRARQLADSFRYNRATDTAATQGVVLQPGDSYDLEVVLPPSPSDAAGQAILDVRGKNSADAVPQELLSWAAPLVQKVERDERGAKLADELRDVGVYSDGNPTQEISLGGHTQKRLTDFIASEQPVGNAEQFAAALGLMLRGDNIPARVVSGFLPQKWTDGPIDILGTDAEAWVELPVEGLGWSLLDPTPVRTKTQLDEQPAQRPQPERNTQVPPPPPVLVEDPRSEPAKQLDRPKNDKPDAETPKAGAGIPTFVLVGAAITAPPLLLVGGACAVVLGLKARRRRRRRSAATPEQQITGGWSELLDTARDFGRPVPDMATRRELAGFVGLSGATLLAQDADVAVFAPDESSLDAADRYWSHLESTLGELKSQVGWWDRVKAKLSLTSLRRTRK